MGAPCCCHASFVIFCHSRKEACFKRDVLYIYIDMQCFEIKTKIKCWWQSSCHTENHEHTHTFLRRTWCKWMTMKPPLRFHPSPRDKTADSGDINCYAKDCKYWEADSYCMSVSRMKYQWNHKSSVSEKMPKDDLISVYSAADFVQTKQIRTTEASVAQRQETECFRLLRGAWSVGKTDTNCWPEWIW